MIKKRSFCRQKFPAGLSKVRLKSPEESFEICFHKSSFLLTTFELSAENLFSFWRKVFGRIVKLLRVQRNILGKSLFLRRLNFFFQFPDFEQNVFGLWAENFPEVPHNYILRLQRSLLMVVLWEKNFVSSFSDFISKKFVQIVTEAFWQTCQKCTLGVQGKFLRKHNFFSSSSN